MTDPNATRSDQIKGGMCRVDRFEENLGVVELDVGGSTSARLQSAGLESGEILYEESTC